MRLEENMRERDKIIILPPRIIFKFLAGLAGKNEEPLRQKAPRECEASSRVARHGLFLGGGGDALHYFQEQDDGAPHGAAYRRTKRLAMGWRAL